MAAPILATKLFIPPARPNIISRPRLIEHLNASLHHRLTLISAPAGFGKTTLVSEWLAGVSHAENQGAEQRPCAAWVSLDEGDNDPTRFLTYLIAAIQRLAACRRRQSFYKKDSQTGSKRTLIAAKPL